MLRRIVCASAVLLLVGSLVVAETVRGTITSVSDDEVKITTRGKKGEKGEEKTYKVTKDTKFMKMKGKDDEEKSSMDDLKKAISGAKKGKGAFGSVEVEDGKATKISFGAGGTKKGKKDKDK